MNINKIREILSLPMGDEAMAFRILEAISEDEAAGEMLVQLLAADRNRKKQLIMNINLELSRAHLVIRDKAMWDKLHEFVDGEIVKFYKEHRDQVGHCFANMDKLPEPPEENSPIP